MDSFGVALLGERDRVVLKTGGSLMSNNRQRILAEVLSLDAWHKPFRIDGETSAVHVEVSFEQGRIGGDDPQMPFTFRLSLRKALLTVKLEPPLTIDRNTIARSIPENPVELSHMLSTESESKSSLSSEGRLSLKGASASVSGSIGDSAAAKTEQRMKLIQSSPRIRSSPKPGGPREYSWEIAPTFEDYLDGQPWHPVHDPRLYVKHPLTKQMIDPTIKVTLSCSIDDLLIDDLTPKSDKPLSIIRHAVKNDISYAAAVQYLKIVLTSADLEVGMMDNRFSRFLIADTMAVEG